MIKKALREITVISDDENDNIENYLDALNYLDNLYKLVTVLQKYVSINDIYFLPSFKGKYIVERLGIPSTDEENNLKYFRIQSSLFNSDINTVSKIKTDCTRLCDNITQDNDIITFILK